MRSQTFWERTYHRNIAKMIGVNLRYVGDRAVAEDLAHDAILKAIEKSGSYRHLGSFEGWLMRLNLNNTLDYLRRQPQFLSIDDAPDSVIVETCPGASPRLDDISESDILDAICALPERQRVVFNLYVFEKQTHKKIADKLQIGIRSSKRYLSEARTQLQQILKDKQSTKKSGIMIILMMITRQSHAIDRLCLAKLKKMAVAPVTPSPLASLDWAAVPKSSLWLTLSAAKATAIATGVVATAVTGSVVAWQAQPAPTPAAPTPQETVATTRVATDTAIVNTDTAVVETRHGTSLQEPPYPDQQVIGTELSVSPLPETSASNVVEKFRKTSLPSHHSLRKFERNGYYGLQDEKGNIVVYPKYSKIQPFDEYRTGWAMVEIFGFKGFVDSSGKEVVPAQYDEIGKFGFYRDGCALVRKGNFYGFINTAGKEVVPVTHKKNELIN
ncbi:MAG: sigma-70 family RNA polymerase sigma factor [Bacteroidales bacterium]|nr:sigma-70 family RNA polymerase sigma factor [Bacteroidales bacterium]